MSDEPIRPGYKRTEVGVIPQDWDVVRLGEIASFYSGGTPSTSVPEYYGGNIDWITSSDLNKGRIYWVTGKITEKGLRNSSAKLIRQGTLLMALYGATAGIVSISQIQAAINQAVLAILPSSASEEYLFQQLSRLKDWIVRTYTQGGQPNLSGQVVKSIPLALPTVPEQHCIAEALSDVDALLDALDRLIAKKRAIKQGAMQALLTGRVRLPGFERKPGYKRTEVGVIPEDWEVKTFDELFDFLSTSSCSRSDLSESGNIHYIHYGDIHTRWDYNLDFDAESVPLVAFEKVKNIARLQDGDLIMVDASEDEEGVGKSVEILNLGGRSAVAGLHTLALRSKGGDLVNGFKAYLQANQAVRTQIRRVATGLKVFGISKNNLRDIFVPLPGPLEQTAIAEVLSDMDAEIETLERRRAKVRAIKQGMMQELLTGRVRLVGPNAEQ